MITLLNRFINIIYGIYTEKEHRWNLKMKIHKIWNQTENLYCTVLPKNSICLWKINRMTGYINYEIIDE